MSLPLRERGLKQQKGITILITEVAPPTGAWIETAQCNQKTGQILSLPLRERGLKQNII